MKLADVRPPPDSGYDLDHAPYRMCGQFNGRPMPSMPNRVFCEDTAIGEYLYIYIPRQNYLHFCEVEAFGMRKY